MHALCRIFTAAISRRRALRAEAREAERLASVYAGHRRASVELAREREMAVMG